VGGDGVEAAMTAGYWFALAAGGVVTYAIRALFFVFADRFADLPDGLRELLRMIPAAALAALAIPPLFRPDHRFEVVSPELFAGVVAALVALRTRSLVATIVAGMVAVVALEALMG
jgi:branched-subunit amino acid transport protein